MKKCSLLFIVFLLTHSCQRIQYPAFQQSVSATTGVVSSGQPLATLAGKLMLDKGGNAVDAAVASAFALSVVEPSMSGLGGRLQAIVRLADGTIQGVDATTEAPASYDSETLSSVHRYGYKVIGIPGVVAGLTSLHKKYGSLPLDVVMKPAIRYARKGFPLLKGEAFRHSLAINQLREFEGSRHYFMNGDTTYTEGQRWIQKDLAQTLSKISSQGKDGFYKGEIAEKIVADFQANGGFLKLHDLANYEARSSTIVEGTYRGFDLHGLWLPSFGAITIEIMQILEHLPMNDLHGADWLSAVGQAIELAYADRYRQKSGIAVVDTILDKAYAKTLANRIDVNHPGTGFQSKEMPDSWTTIDGHTTHLSTADENGMMVGLTQSLGPNMGSKVASSDLGFLYAVTLGPYLGVTKGGERAISHISPFIITKDGEPYLVVGAAGGSRIITAIAAVTSRMIDHNLSITEALKAPRVFPDKGKLLLEVHEGTDWNEEDAAELTAEGFSIELIDQAARFGRVHAIHYDLNTKQWTGAADPDWEGVAASKKDD